MALDVAGAQANAVFGRLLRQHRERAGLTQRELADLSTISVRAIRDLERGQVARPRRETASMLAEGLRLGPQARVLLLASARSTGVSDVFAELEARFKPISPLHALHGRENEVATLAAELASGERLITLTGLPGAGKSSVAAQVAQRLRARHHVPVLWLEAPLGDPARAAGTRHPGVSHVLSGLLPGLLDGPAGARHPASARADERGARPWTELAALTRSQPTILVVDGLADRRFSSPRLMSLLDDCPRLRVLSTADAPHGVSGERVLPLGALETASDASESAGDPRVRLLSDAIRRAGLRLHAQNDLPVLARICDLVDGLPLALMCVASWFTVFPVHEVWRRLASGPDSLLMHAAGINADARLTDGLRTSLHALSRGCRDLITSLAERPETAKFTLDDVTALSRRPLTECSALVRELRARSLIRVDESLDGRFRLLNLVRATALTDPAW